MKRFFGRIGLIWAAIVFLVSWLWVWPGFQMIKLTKKGDALYKAAFNWTKLWGRFMLFFLGVKTKVFFPERNAAGQLVVYVCNHRSQIDIPINFTTNPQFVILSKSEALKIPVVGTNLSIGHVTVDRKSKQSRKEAMEKLKFHLRQGRSLLIYPEGRRPREDVLLGEFQDGAFQMAVEFQVPIIPVTIVNSDGINNPKRPYELYPGKVEVYFGEAIETTGKTSKDIDELKEQVKTQMVNYLKIK